jgi:hypothetical protein
MNPRIRLFRYRKPAHAARTLRALRIAWPANRFDLVPEGWDLCIRATLPDGRSALVAKVPLASFGRA